MVRVRGSGLQNANALARSLARVTPEYGRGKKSDPRTPAPRIDVVSESLCNDVIEYLAPTLEKHKGCTLIDLQPGACLFSSKIHDFLRPKRHLLLEPEDHYYEPFIKPLLDKPGSTYRYERLNITSLPSYWNEIERIQKDPNILPIGAPLATDDPARRQFDPTTLIIGNLARQVNARLKSHRIAPSHMTLHSLSQQALANQHLYQHGLVRTLLWIPEEDRSAIISVLPLKRSSLDTNLAMGLQISEVIATQPAAAHVSMSTANDRRAPSRLYDALVERDVAQKMKAAGMSTPHGREMDSSLDEVTRNAHSVVSLSPLEVGNVTLESLHEHIVKIRQRLVETGPSIRAKTGKKPNLKLADLLVSEPRIYPQVDFLVNEYAGRMESHGNKYNWTISRLLVDLGLCIMNLEAQYKTLEDRLPKSAELNGLRDEILELDASFDVLVDMSAIRTRLAIHALLDDQLAFLHSPRLLNIHERSYEALKAKVTEFWPKQELTLLDLVPKSRDLSVPGLATSQECARVCTELVQILMTKKASPLPQALDGIGINAAQDLIPMVPAISDIRRGGRLNPQRLRARMVTEEMIEGLGKAYFEWPFRPQTWQLALSSGDDAEEASTKKEDDAETETETEIRGAL